MKAIRASLLSSPASPLSTDATDDVAPISASSNGTDTGQRAEMSLGASEPTVVPVARTPKNSAECRSKRVLLTKRARFARAIDLAGGLC